MEADRAYSGSATVGIGDDIAAKVDRTSEAGVEARCIGDCGCEVGGEVKSCFGDSIKVFGRKSGVLRADSLDLGSKSTGGRDPL